MDTKKSAMNADNVEPVMLPGRLVYTMEIDLETPLTIGNGPKGTRVIVAVSGKVYGPELNGDVVPPSSDWLTVGSDNTLVGINLSVVIRTDDGHLIYKYVTGRSMRDVSNPSNSKIRSGVTFEAPPGKYQYLIN